MPKLAFKMKLFAGCETEYAKRHAAIWPELVRELRAAGISDYSIFLDPETNLLFGVQNVRDDYAADELAATAIMKKWWAYMADLMETHDDHSPRCTMLNEVFHMD